MDWHKNSFISVLPQIIPYIYKIENVKDLSPPILQTKLASVKLAMKYLKRVSAELEAVGGPEEEELMLQGVRFAFRVHQVISILGYMYNTTFDQALPWSNKF